MPCLCIYTAQKHAVLTLKLTFSLKLNYLHLKPSIFQTESYLENTCLLVCYSVPQLPQSNPVGFGNQRKLLAIPCQRVISEYIFFSPKQARQTQSSLWSRTLCSKRGFHRRIRVLRRFLHSSKSCCELGNRAITSFFLPQKTTQILQCKLPTNPLVALLCFSIDHFQI